MSGSNRVSCGGQSGVDKYLQLWNYKSENAHSAKVQTSSSYFHLKFKKEVRLCHRSNTKLSSLETGSSRAARRSRMLISHTRHSAIPNLQQSSTQLGFPEVYLDTIPNSLQYWSNTASSSVRQLLVDRRRQAPEPQQSLHYSPSPVRKRSVLFSIQPAEPWAIPKGVILRQCAGAA